MSASIDDVAGRAGVSTATVSRALRGLPNVSAATRDRVLRAAAELDYVVSPSASSLASGRSRVVGVVVPYVNRWFFSQVICAVEAVLRAAGFDLLLYNVGDDAARERFFREMPLRKRVAAVLVLSLAPSEAEADALRALGVPVVSVGSEADGLASVRIDDRAAGRAAVQHLVDLGHRDIALVSSGWPVPMHFTAPVDRRQAYLDVHRSTGLPVDPALEADGQFTLDGGERATTELLGRGRRPTAVFAMSDEMAFGVLRAMRRHGLRAPADLSVVGIDGHELADLLDLTTVAQPVLEQGEVAARLLLRLLDEGGREVPAPTVLPTRLVVRGTTAPPPGPAPLEVDRPASGGTDLAGAPRRGRARVIPGGAARATAATTA